MCTYFVQEMFYFRITEFDVRQRRIKIFEVNGPLLSDIRVLCLVLHLNVTF